MHLAVIVLAFVGVFWFCVLGLPGRGTRKYLLALNVALESAIVAHEDPEMLCVVMAPYEILAINLLLEGIFWIRSQFRLLTGK